MTLEALRLLRHLYEVPELTAEELAQRSSLSLPGTYSGLDRLLFRGWVTEGLRRHGSRNQEVKVYAISVAGRGALMLELREVLPPSILPHL